MPRPNPDDRSDNVERLQDHLRNTYENLEEAEDFVKAHDEDLPPKQIDQVRDKNERRRQAIRDFRDEIKDEAHRDE